MSWSVAIFISGAPSLEVLAEELRIRYGLALVPFHDELGIRYRSVSTDSEITLYSDHGLENDGDLDFEAYEYELALWRGTVRDPEEAQERIRQLAWSIFEQLKERSGYKLMLVENTQKKLASFEPNLRHSG